MNKNNNAANKEENVIAERTMLYSSGSSNQGKEQGIGSSLPVAPNSIQANYNGANYVSNPYVMEDVFGSPPAAVSLPFASSVFVSEVNTASPPPFRPNPPRPFQSPSRSMSMPLAPTSRPSTHGQFNVRHAVANHFLPPYNSHSSYAGVHALMPVHTVPEGFRAANNHSSHIAPRFSVLHASGALPQYRTPGDLPPLRPPFSTTLLPGAVSSGIAASNLSSEKEQKETTNTRKKRKACGHCEPCRRKENCGSCMNCINRAKGKQICIHRKCEVLKKKPGTSYSSSSSSSVPEKRKETEGAVFARDAKRHKSIENSNDQSSALIAPIHPNFPEYTDHTHFLTQRFAERNILPKTRPAATSSESLPFLANSAGYNQFCPPATEAVGTSSANLPVPIEESDLISQAFHEIETSSDSAAFGAPGITEGGAAPRNTGSQSHLQQLQPSLVQAAISDWNPDFSDKLLKTFTSDAANAQLARHLSTVAFHPDNAADSISKADHLLHDLHKFDSSPALKTSSLNQQDQLQNESFFADSQLQRQKPEENILNSAFEGDSSFHQGSQLINRDLQMTSYNQNLDGQLSSPMMPLAAPANANSQHPAVSASSSNNSALYSNTLPAYQTDFEQKASLAGPLSWNPSQVPHFSQFGLDQGDRFLDSLNSSPFSCDPYWGALSDHTRAANLPAGFPNVRPETSLQLTNLSTSNQQHAQSFATRRASNSSGDGYRMQRHMSVGSGNSSQSPLVHNPSGSVSISHGAMSSDGNLQSPSGHLPANSPILSHVPGAVGSPATPLSHVSPTLSTNNPSAQGQTNDFPAPPSRDTQSNGSGPWHEQQTPPSLSYHAHVSHTLATGESFSPKPRTPSSLLVNPAQNHFLAQPGSRLNSRPTQPPCHGNAADRKEESAIPPFDGSASIPAARLAQPDNQLKDDSTGPAFNSDGTAVARQIFTETMNSVLYGRPGSAQLRNAKSDSDSQRHVSSRSIESPSDVHPTISPGESGYDSTEPSSVTSEISSQHSLPTVGDASATHQSEQQPKNVQAALMGSKSRPAFTLEQCHTAAVATHDRSKPRPSPIKAASASTSHSDLSDAVEVKPTTDLPLTRTIPPSNCLSTDHVAIKSDVIARNAPMLARSTSLDSGYRDAVDCDQVSESNKQLLSLRRYSFQGTTDHDEKLPGKSLPLTGHTGPRATVEIIVDTSVKNVKSSPAFNPILSGSAAVADDRKTYSGVASNPAQLTNCAPPQMAQRHTEVAFTSDDLRGRIASCPAANGSLVKKTVFPQCSCLADSDKEDNAPYYTHLGAAPDVAGIRKVFEERIGYKGSALRIEKAVYTGKEGKTSHGCPIAKWVLRRSSDEEKVLVICRRRPGHRCATTYVVIMIMLWEGLEPALADETYDKCTGLIPTNRAATERRCSTNEERTCACQGFNDDTGGASFSFGCSWSMYYNGCKFARSVNPSKFKLGASKEAEAEPMLTNFCQYLSTVVGDVYKMAAPEAHRNQTELEKRGTECRLGCNPEQNGRPFSGVTCCMDFCAHSHKDKHNMDNGTTVVLSLTKAGNRSLGTKPSDEQFHVLPLYRWDPSNEDGTLSGLRQKVESGAVEILSGFHRAVRLRDKPQGTCKQRKERRRKADPESFSTPPKRQRNKKIKRSFSMEDVSGVDQPLASNGHQMASEQNRSNCQGFHPYWNSPTEKPLPPAPSQCYSVPSQHPSTMAADASEPLLRWPYRRNASSSTDIGTPLSASNLPSIGSIFVSPASPSLTDLSGDATPLPDAGQWTSPQRPFHFGRRFSSSSPSYFDSQSPLVDHFLSDNRTVTPEHHNPVSQRHPAVKSEPRDDPYAFHCAPPRPAEQADMRKIYTQLEPSVSIKKEPLSNSPSICKDPNQESPYKVQGNGRREYFTNSEENFTDPDIGGLAIAPCHGSILIECAKRELHATTSLLEPNRFHPSRVSLVFYQHKNMNYRNHGAAEYVAKEAKRSQEKAEKLQREAAESKEQSKLEANRFSEHQQTHYSASATADALRPYAPHPMTYPRANTIHTQPYHFPSNSFANRWWRPPTLQHRPPHLESPSSPSFNPAHPVYSNAGDHPTPRFPQMHSGNIANGSYFDTPVQGAPVNQYSGSNYNPYPSPRTPMSSPYPRFSASPVYSGYKDPSFSGVIAPDPYSQYPSIPYPPSGGFRQANFPSAMRPSPAFPNLPVAPIPHRAEMPTPFFPAG